MEFADIEQPEEVQRLATFSPYHLVLDGVCYPAVFIDAGDTDPRCPPWHARKFAACLQAATAGDEPILLNVRENVGHGWASDRTVTVDSYSEWLAFVMQKLGLTADACSNSAECSGLGLCLAYFSRMLASLTVLTDDCAHGMQVLGEDGVIREMPSGQVVSVFGGGLPISWERLACSSAGSSPFEKEVFPHVETLRQATSTNAAIVQLEGKLGCVSEGAYANLLVVDGDPSKDIDLLAASG